MDRNKLKVIVIVSIFILIVSILAIIFLALKTDSNNTVNVDYTETITMLPYETDEFLIEHTGNNQTSGYTISLYAILNGDSQLDSYKTDLATYKKNAVAWLKSNGIDYKKIQIQWLPEDPGN